MPHRHTQVTHVDELLNFRMSDTRVLMVIPTLNLVGGAQDQLKLLSDELTKVGFQHDVRGLDSLGAITPHRSGIFRFFIYVAGAALWYLKVAFVLAQWGRKYNIVHLHGLGFPLFVLGFVSSVSDLRLVVKIPRSGEGSYIQSLSSAGLRRIWFLLFCAKACTFVALTKDAKLDLQNAGVDDARIVHIPNGVQVPQAPSNKNSGKNVRIVFAGRLIERKNLRDAILASHELRSEGIDEFEIVIIGDGPDRLPLEKLAQELGLARNIRFLGELSNTRVLAEFDDASIFVLPSRSEGMSNSLLQACARSCAPVISDIPQHRELFEDGRSGMFFSSVEGLVDRLRFLIQSKQFEEVGRQARKVIYDRYNITAVAQRYLEIYGAN